MDLITPESLALSSFLLMILIGAYSLRKSNGYAHIDDRQSRAEQEMAGLRERLAATETQIRALEHQLKQAETINNILAEQITELVQKNAMLHDANQNLIRRIDAAEATASALRAKYGNT